MAQEIFPLAVWTSQITQASVPANDNSLRIQAAVGAAIGFASVPPSAVEDDQYVIQGNPTGGWSGFANGDIVIFKGGTWLAFAPFFGLLKTVNGIVYTYAGGGVWEGQSDAAGAKQTIVAVFGGGPGTVIPAGMQVDVMVPYPSTITAATLLADRSGDILVNAWLADYDNFPPTSLGDITGGANLSISANQKSRDTTLTGWNTTVLAGSIIRFTVVSATTIERCSVILEATRV